MSSCAIVQLKLRRYHKSTRDLLTAINQVDETVKSYQKLSEVIACLSLIPILNNVPDD